MGSQHKCEKWCKEEAHGQIGGQGIKCLVWSKTTGVLACPLLGPKGLYINPEALTHRVTGLG
jgi:hypothetical protein